jgi:hypothetical protein
MRSFYQALEAARRAGGSDDPLKPLFHRGGPVPCGKPSILVHALPGRYEIAADNVRLLNGQRPKRGDAMRCGSCGQPVVPQWLFPYPDMVMA